MDHLLLCTTVPPAIAKLCESYVGEKCLHPDMWAPAMLVFFRKLGFVDPTYKPIKGRRRRCELQGDLWYRTYNVIDRVCLLNPNLGQPQFAFAQILTERELLIPEALRSEEALRPEKDKKPSVDAAKRRSQKFCAALKQYECKFNGVRTKEIMVAAMDLSEQNSQFHNDYWKPFLNSYTKFNKSFFDDCKVVLNGEQVKRGRKSKKNGV